MKRLLLVLGLVGGMMGCDAGEKLRAPEGPKINPLSLLDQSLGMREAVCQYGLKTEQFKDRGECGKFWKSKDREMEREIEDWNIRYKVNNNFPGIDYMKYGLMPGEGSLVMFYGSSKPEHTISRIVYIVVREKIDWP